MNMKEVYVGSQGFRYNKLEKNVKYAISIYNENTRKLNFYFFDEDDDWKMENEDPYSPFIITVYEMEIDNKIMYTVSLKMIKDEDVQFKISSLGENKPTNLNTEHMNVEVNQHVPKPNSLTLQFEQKNSPLFSNTNYYILLLTERVTGVQYLELIETTSRTISSSISLKSRQKYEYQLYKVHQQNKQLTVTHETRLITIVTRKLN
ncbi:hypothetical protein LOTGIDRAFT_161425 [Lottia gigantea]|uniref:Uncharacterized protein n=1 Tax=Lottia gigantea TaxID=225164 RepID=V4ABM3_LOTGI|nr:hypothetical protein LOTGIDRAFT_161425 [Lottia gigantea]ESO94217.1 hypothetical protein LOTGIDRAFT_161425 [Lottia gigantea]